MVWNVEICIFSQTIKKKEKQLEMIMGAFSMLSIWAFYELSLKLYNTYKTYSYISRFIHRLIIIFIEVQTMSVCKG